MSSPVCLSYLPILIIDSRSEIISQVLTNSEFWVGEVTEAFSAALDRADTIGIHYRMLVRFACFCIAMRGFGVERIHRGYRDVIVVMCEQSGVERNKIGIARLTEQPSTCTQQNRNCSCNRTTPNLHATKILLLAKSNNPNLQNCLLNHPYHVSNWSDQSSTMVNGPVQSRFPKSRSGPVPGDFSTSPDHWKP